MENIFLVIGEIFKKAVNLKIYSIDSFPIQLCDITREKRCRLWNDEKFKEYNASTHDITAFSGFLTKLKLFLLSYSLDCFYKANYATI